MRIRSFWPNFRKLSVFVLGHTFPYLVGEPISLIVQFGRLFETWLMVIVGFNGGEGDEGE